MTATQDTNLTSVSLGQAKKGLLRIQAQQEGGPGLWAQAAPLFPPSTVASGGPSFLPFLTMKSVWGLGVSPDLEFLHCLPLLTHMPQVLPPRLICQSLLQSEESLGCANPIISKLIRSLEACTFSLIGTKVRFMYGS